MIVIPASLRSDFIHIAGMTIHIALESTIHIAGILRLAISFPFRGITLNSSNHMDMLRLSCMSVVFI